MSNDTRKIADDVTPASLSPEAEVAALPIVDAPAISPVIAETAPVEPTPADPASVETDPKPAAPVPTATQRFRATAAAQIAGARERMAQRKLPSMSAVALLAGVAGAVSSLGAARVLSPTDRDVSQVQVLSNTVTRLEAVVAGLREEIERTTKLAEAQAGETSERFARFEQAQAEPSAKIIKLSEAIEKLRAANATIAAAPPKGAAASDVTGSITPPAGKTAAKPRSTAIVDGWALRELDRDIALVEGKRGLLEILVGDDIPGVGRVESFRKQDGHWVVVTSKGLIVPR